MYEINGMQTECDACMFFRRGTGPKQSDNIFFFARLKRVVCFSNQTNVKAFVSQLKKM